MKPCISCKETKPLSDFYHMKSMRDGRLNKCKECYKRDVRMNRLANIDRYREYDRNRGNRQSNDYVQQYRKKYPLKWKAHCSLNNAVRSGKVIRPDCCEECGSTFHIEGHHDDYSKPLEVRWLCSACHKQWHAKHGEAKNAA